MTEEQALLRAKALALAMGITFYVVRNREGGFAVQLPPDDAKSSRPCYHPPASTIEGWGPPRPGIAATRRRA